MKFEDGGLGFNALQTDGDDSGIDKKKKKFSSSQGGFTTFPLGTIPSCV